MAGRSRASAKAAGTRFESLIADYLSAEVSDYIERRRLSGSNDRGDLTGLRAVGGARGVAELKDYGGQIKAGEWLNEMELERGHDDALWGVVIAKRRGTTDPGSQFVLMTARDLVVLLTGRRPDEQ